MAEPIIRLLFTEKPYSDESLAGYLLRLGELNFVERLSWILKSSKLNGKLNSPAYPGISSKENLGSLAALTGTNEQILNSLAYKINPDFPNRRKPRYILFGLSIPAYFIVSKNSRICPLCLAQANYLRRIWEFAPLTVCLMHKCRLIDICPNCQKFLRTDRRSISQCFCGYDWRSADPFYVLDNELRIAAIIVCLSGLEAEVSVFQENGQLPDTLRKLGLLSLLKLLLFFASVLAGLSERSGKKLFSLVANTELHEYLNFALVIFDNFPRNFFIFLDWIKHQKFLGYFNTSSFNERQKIGDGKRQSIENFELILRNEFIAPEYAFVLDSFEDYLNYGSRGYISDLHFSHNPTVLALFYRRLVKSRQSICELRGKN